MKKNFVLFLCLILVGCREESTVSKSENCTLNGQSVDCNLVRGVVDSKSSDNTPPKTSHTNARAKNTIVVSLTASAKITDPSWTFLEESLHSKEDQGNICELSVQAGEVFKIVKIDEDHMKITSNINSEDSGIFERVKVAPDEWERVIEDTENDITDTYKISFGPNRFLNKTILLTHICQFH